MVNFKDISNNILEEEVKNIETFLIAQFIDVMELMEKYNNIEDIKNDIRQRKELYIKNIKNINVYESFWKINICNDYIAKRIRDVKEGVYKSHTDDAILAYKVGLIDGLKYKNINI